MYNGQKVGAVIVAAGKGERMSGIDKIFTPLGSMPVLAHSVSVFERCELIDQIVIVLSEQSIEAGQELSLEESWSKVSDFCAGGERRQDSVRNGLELLEGCEWVLVHDGARPLLEESLITRGLEKAESAGAAVCAVPVKDTIKQTDKTGLVIRTLERENLWAVQTPQVFSYEILKDAYETADGDFTDDAALAEGAGAKVKIYMGSYDNIKITTPQDIIIAQEILKNRGY